MKTPSFWDGIWTEQRRTKVLLQLLGVCNVGFAAVNVFFWSAAALIVSDPISWATWSGLGSISSRPGLFEYPFVLLWLLPVLGTTVAAINSVLGFKTAAKVSAAFPLALMGITLGWWFLFQDQFR